MVATLKLAAKPWADLRVLHVNAGNLYGGIETMLVTIAREQALRPGLECGFATCFEGRYTEEVRATGATVLSIGAARVSRPWTVWRVRRRLAEILRDDRWDAVICHGCWPYAISAPTVRRAGLPLVFWAHGLHDGRHWLERWARRTTPDLVVANSQMTRRAVEAHLFPAAPSEVLHCPVTRPRLANLRELRRQTRVAMGAAPETIALMISSRLEPWKGHKELLDALGKIKAVPRWDLWIAGGAQRPAEETYLAGLRRQATELGIADRVRFLGQRADVPQLLASADIHCQPNTAPEPFGIAFIEALYAGLPVVTSALGGALEIVDETCGVLVTPGSTEELAGALTRLMASDGLRKRLGVNGRARAASLCDPAARLADLKCLLEKTCGIIPTVPNYVTTKRAA